MTLDALVPHLEARIARLEPNCGATVVVAVDGRAGSGKTTLGRRLAADLGCPLVSMDGLYPGWDGLADGVRLLATEVLEPLSRGRTALVPQWDWATDAPGAPWPLEPPPLLVVEGVGCGAKSSSPYLSFLVWLDTGYRVRKARALARAEDGAEFVAHWDEWADQESALLVVDPVPERADLFVTTVIDEDEE